MGDFLKPFRVSNFQIIWEQEKNKIFGILVIRKITFIRLFCFITGNKNVKKKIVKHLDDLIQAITMKLFAMKNRKIVKIAISMSFFRIEAKWSELNQLSN